jgi:four helix bundle protein
MSFVKLIVFQKSYALAMDVFKLSNQFPKEEVYALTDQIRRSSRSVCANIAEGYRKKIYPKSFVAKMVDADGECSETTVHLMFARDCGYISEQLFDDLTNRYNEVGRMLGRIIRIPKIF